MPRARPAAGVCAYCGRVTRRFDHRHGVYACSKIVTVQRQANGVLGSLPFVFITCIKQAKEKVWTILK